jgi:hypothetical protein
MTPNLSLPAGIQDLRQGEGPGILDPDAVGVNPNTLIVRNRVPFRGTFPTTSPGHEASSLHRAAPRKPPPNSVLCQLFRGKGPTRGAAGQDRSTLVGADLVESTRFSAGGFIG